MECEDCKYETHVIYITEQGKKICYRCKEEQGARECRLVVEPVDEDSDEV